MNWGFRLTKMGRESPEAAFSLLPTWIPLCDRLPGKPPTVMGCTPKPSPPKPFLPHVALSDVIIAMREEIDTVRQRVQGGKI